MLKRFERYSRENLDKAEEEIKRTKEEAEKHPGHTSREYFQQSGDSQTWVAGAPHRDVYHPSKQEKVYGKAKKHYKRLEGKAYEEASELEQKHENLIRAVEDAQNALYEFEKNKLNIHKQEEE